MANIKEKKERVSIYKSSNKINKIQYFVHLFALIELSIHLYIFQKNYIYAKFST